MDDTTNADLPADSLSHRYPSCLTLVNVLGPGKVAFGVYLSRVGNDDPGVTAAMNQTYEDEIANAYRTGNITEDSLPNVGHILVLAAAGITKLEPDGTSAKLDRLRIYSEAGELGYEATREEMNEQREQLGDDVFQQQQSAMVAAIYGASDASGVIMSAFHHALNHGQVGNAVNFAALGQRLGIFRVGEDGNFIRDADGSLRQFKPDEGKQYEATEIADASEPSTDG